MLRRWIEAALEGHDLTADEVEEGILRGDFFLFEVEGGCAIAEFVVSPRMKAIHVFAAGGNKNDGGLAAVRKAIPQIEAFGKRHGCTTGGGTGRRGWVRALKDLGYTESETSVEKVL